MESKKERWFKAPYSIFDLGLDPYSIAVLFFIISKTVGYKKESDKISYSQIVKNTKISKDKVVKVIKELEIKGLIAIVKQSNINGGKDINSYTLNLYRSKDKGSLCDGQGGGTPHGHTIEYIKERENNIFFLLDKNLQDQAIEKYLDHLVSNRKDIRSFIVYKSDIKHKILNNHKKSINGFFDWLEKEAPIKISLELDKDEGFIYKGTYSYSGNKFDIQNDNIYWLEKNVFYKYLKADKIKIINIEL